jgi:hypothetical protein
MNISGTWLGTYWQNGQPTRFEVTFAQGGNALSGSILDDSPLGEAQLSGEVVGRSIQFVKRYLTSALLPIVYAGTISEDGNLMTGTWQIDAGRGFMKRKQIVSGNWEAHRSDDDLMAELNLRMAQKVPATVEQ